MLLVSIHNQINYDNRNAICFHKLLPLVKEDAWSTQCLLFANFIYITQRNFNNF